jgi:hypothetical protein
MFIERTDKNGKKSIGKIIFIDLAGYESFKEIGFNPKKIHRRLVDQLKYDYYSSSHTTSCF